METRRPVREKISLWLSRNASYLNQMLHCLVEWNAFIFRTLRYIYMPFRLSCHFPKWTFYSVIFSEQLVNFKIENGDPVLDIKCIFCEEMILHAPTKLKLSNEHSCTKSFLNYRRILSVALLSKNALFSSTLQIIAFLVYC